MGVNLSSAQGISLRMWLKYAKSDKFAAQCTPKRPMGGKQARGGERGSAPLGRREYLRASAQICGLRLLK